MRTTSSWRQATTRWADDDVYGHMNNARYFELIDTAVNAHLAEATGVDIRSLPAIGVVAEVGCRYFREIGYPEPVDMGLVVDKVGTSSVVYRIGLFQGDPEGEGAEAAAEGRFVHVYVDNTGGRTEARPVTPLPDEIRAAVDPPAARLTPTRVVGIGAGTTLAPVEGALMGAIVVVAAGRRSVAGRSRHALRRLPLPRRGRPPSRRWSARRCSRGVDSLPTLGPEHPPERR